jgi:hypothetical protein
VAQRVELLQQQQVWQLRGVLQAVATCLALWLVWCA